ncbi:MAG: peptidoglycan-binding domain-containing protein [Eubacteriales bacterium]|nr:peptidoglycan-binding domain-containing protein [Eubacteriales bacterium]
MDLLKTLLLYMSMVYASSLLNAPDVNAVMDTLATPTPTATATATVSATVPPTATPSPVPTIDISPNPDYQTLRVGDKGDEVLKLQQKLADYGYYTGELDGRYGNQSRQAVERFQYNHGLQVDGIAGKNTLTVLYDSDEVRYGAPTPSPTPEPKSLIVALTPAVQETETPAPTFVPTASPATTQTESADASTPTPTNTPSPTPTATPEPAFLPLEGWTIRLTGQSEPLRLPAAQGEQQGALITPYVLGDTVYVPLIPILQADGGVIVPSDSLDMTEYAFALGSDLFRITYTEQQNGSPTDLNVYKNGTPQILPIRDVRLGGELIYLPGQSVSSLTGILFDVNQIGKVLTVTFPEAVDG